MTPVIRLASRRAAPPSPMPPVQGTPDPIQLHAEAHNALAMALHYLRQPVANVPGAARKAVQALAALRSMDAAGQSLAPVAPIAPDAPELLQGSDIFDFIAYYGNGVDNTAALARFRAWQALRKGGAV